ncbi:MAG: hypothetical protein EOO10_12965 [Chitinophagaceae bacterium]|nr:MAG: hypothetical protein EOO10_12965 [Chitinophagaceae bacterium]
MADRDGSRVKYNCLKSLTKFGFLYDGNLPELNGIGSKRNMAGTHMMRVEPFLLFSSLLLIISKQFVVLSGKPSARPFPQTMFVVAIRKNNKCNSFGAEYADS